MSKTRVYMAPLTGRKVFTKTKVGYFDRETASVKTEEVESASMHETPESARKKGLCWQQVWPLLALVKKH